MAFKKFALDSGTKAMAKKAKAGDADAEAEMAFMAPEGGDYKAFIDAAADGEDGAEMEIGGDTELDDSGEYEPDDEGGVEGTIQRVLTSHGVDAAEVASLTSALVDELRGEGYIE